MDVLQAAGVITGKKQKLDWSEANSLWAVARNKLIGLSTLEIYLSQAVDNELKLLIEMGIKKQVVPHTEKIIKKLHQEGLDVPYIIGRTELDLYGKNTGERTFLRDNEIAQSLREVMRLAIFLSLRGIVEAKRDDVLDLLWNILSDDFAGFRQLIALQKRKNWLFKPPSLGSEKNIKTDDRMNWGEAAGLWSIARDKLIKLTVLEIYHSQVENKELKLFIETNMKKTVIPVLHKINSLLEEEKFGLPGIFGRTSLETTGRNTGDLNWLKDNEIAVLLKEHLRMVLYIDFEALVDTVRGDLLDFVWDIFAGDFKRFTELTKIQKKNNWLLSPPDAEPQPK